MPAARPPFGASLVIEIRPYRLPLRTPWQSARGTVFAREGSLVLAHAGGATGFGDCAPLPEAGTEMPAQAAARLAHWRDLAGAPAHADPAATLLDALEQAVPSETPAADCAVECALLDLRARLAGLPLRLLLCAEAPDSVAVNAMLGTASALTPERIGAALAAGFRVLKLKVGVADPDAELARIKTAAATLPEGVSLRLDANGAWTEATARHVIERLCGLPVESLEEPVRDPAPEALARLQAAAPFPVALDESLHRLGGAATDMADLPVRRLVLKPGAVGGLRPTLCLARAASAAGREVVITGLVESAAGLWATAHLAAAAGSPLAHGLGTADWLAADLGPPPRPVDGHILLLGDSAGSGFFPGA